MLNKRFYDTCSFLESGDLALQTPFILSYVTLFELEHIKNDRNKDPAIKYKAKKMSHLLDNNPGLYDICYEGKETASNKNIEVYNDSIIAGGAFYCSQNEKIDFFSDDISLKNIARKIFGLNVFSVNDLLKNETEYTGYKTVILSDDETANFYQHMCENHFGCLTNEYIMIKDRNGNIIDKRRWDGSTHAALSYKQVNNDIVGKVKPINPEQELAFDLLQNNNITVKILTGAMGSGKDYLMVSNALNLIKAQRYRKMVWLRNCVEVRDSKPIGFLPGSQTEKLMAFASPLYSHVGGKDGLEILINQGKIELEHLGFLRGNDIKDSVIICTECENMTKRHIQLLISRVGEGSTLWLNGDYHQTDEAIFELNNGLISAIDKLKGQDRFGFVKLDKTERSETAKLAYLLD